MLLAALLALHPWPHGDGPTVAERFSPPPNTERLPLPKTHFGVWARTLPLQPGRGVVRLFDRRPKARQDVHLAVLDIDVGERDLQQCADFAIRLWAEHARALGEDPCFRFTSGHAAPYASHKLGLRPEVRGASVRFVPAAAPSDDRRSFRRWLDLVFLYAGSRSVERDATPVPTSEVEPGDAFVQGGSPGHVVLVLDVASGDGGRWMLLAQSFMPAQDPHVLRAPDGGAWFRAPGPTDGIATPEWRFSPGSLRRLSATGCGPARGAPSDPG